MNAPSFRALIWDVDGTLAETERDGHRVAFNIAFAAMGVPWRWDVERYGRLLSVTGGYERMLDDMQTQPQAPAHIEDRVRLARALHVRKNEAYAHIVAGGGIRLRPGVAELIDECERRGVRQGIATTTSRENVEALLGSQLGAAWRRHFKCVLCAQDAPHKKPDPLVYRLALEQLGVDAREALAIEDSTPGAAAALAAGVAVVVTRSVYFADALVHGALAVGPGLHSIDGWQSPIALGARDRIGVDELSAWFAAKRVVRAQATPSPIKLGPRSV